MLVTGWLALALISLLTVFSFYGLIGFDNGGTSVDTELLGDPYFHTILWFSIKQAFLSAAGSVLLAIPVAKALFYLPKPYARQSFLRLCLVCFIMPTLVLITGLIALLGRSGFISPLLADDWNLYGLSGILIAHIYLNMPFAVRCLYQQLNAIPEPSWRLSSQLKFTSWQRFTVIEWPAIRSVLFSNFGFIFVLCFNSFAVVLALGGGPGATTLEVAIYQALKYDFNIPEALTLAWSQFLIAGLLFLLINQTAKQQWLTVDTGQNRYIPRTKGSKSLVFYGCYIAAWLFLLGPILALIATLIKQPLNQFDLDALLYPLRNSLILAISSATTATALAYFALIPYRRSGSGLLKSISEWLATHTLVAPAMVLSVGLYIYLLPIHDLDRYGMLWVWLINSMVLVPFALSQLKPRVIQFDSQYQQLCRSVKLTAWQYLLIEWPFLRRAFISSFALVMLMAIGDVAVFSIFGSHEWQTLPWLIYNYAGSYRLPEASLSSLILLAFCIAVVWIVERSVKPRSTDA